jgi:hypothetical protein
MRSFTSAASAYLKVLILNWDVPVYSPQSLIESFLRFAARPNSRRPHPDKSYRNVAFCPGLASGHIPIIAVSWDLSGFCYAHLWVLGDKGVSANVPSGLSIKR